MGNVGELVWKQLSFHVALLLFYMCIRFCFCAELFPVVLLPFDDFFLTLLFFIFYCFSRDALFCSHSF